MFDFFNSERAYQKDKEWRDEQRRLRELALDTIKDSQEFLFKMLGKMYSKDYYEWRLDFDKKRYGIE
jgi:hypothetical protein